MDSGQSGPIQNMFIACHGKSIFGKLFIYFVFLLANIIYSNVIDHGKINQHILNFQLYLISMLAMYVVYFLYLALRAFGELRAMNFLDARLKFHAASLSLVLVLTISIVAKR